MFLSIFDATLLLHEKEKNNISNYLLSENSSFARTLLLILFQNHKS